MEAAVRDSLGNDGPARPPDVDDGLIAGIAAYRRHPWRRELSDPPTIWTEGGSRILDYGGTGRPVLFVPSLVNRAYVLDLMPGGSMMRWLAAHGVRPFLLDWGWPGEIERSFNLTDYVVGRLIRAIGATSAATDGPIGLAGYCMGGDLAVAAATLRPDLLAALVLIATPWDFHAGDPSRALRAAAMVPWLEPAMATTGTIPIDALQTLFAFLDPFGVGDKYRAFGRSDPSGPRAQMFVALEDWLNDGVPLAACVGRECLTRWYGENATARGEWRIAGMPVDPSSLRLSTFVAISTRDRIVPPDSARPLAAAIPGAVELVAPAGHVGMVAGSGAEKTLWLPLVNWLTASGR